MIFLKKCISDYVLLPTIYSSHSTLRCDLFLDLCTVCSLFLKWKLLIFVSLLTCWLLLQSLLCSLFIFSVSFKCWSSWGLNLRSSAFFLPLSFPPLLFSPMNLPMRMTINIKMSVILKFVSLVLTLLYSPGLYIQLRLLNTYVYHRHLKLNVFNPIFCLCFFFFLLPYPCTWGVSCIWGSLRSSASVQ